MHVNYTSVFFKIKPLKIPGRMSLTGCRRFLWEGSLKVLPFEHEPRAIGEKEGQGQ